jgi:ABC-type multidrug transport system fused ATPase/permease subunit
MADLAAVAGAEAQPEVATSVWRQQSVWSQTADRLKRDLTRWRVAALALTVAGALLATLGTQLQGVNATMGKTLVWAGAIAVGLVPLLRTLQGPSAVEAWTRARSASESLKEQIYTYLAGVTPYRDHAEQQLRDKADAVVATVDDLQTKVAGIEPATRPLPAVGDVDSYIKVRLDDQIDSYYRRRAASMRSRSRLVHGLQFALSLAAVVLAATADNFQVRGAAAWVPVVTTIGAALAAHAATARYDYLLVEYTRTMAQLQRLRDRHRTRGPAEQDPEHDDAFIADCEHVISAQNEAWMSRLSRDQ